MEEWPKGNSEILAATTITSSECKAWSHKAFLKEGQLAPVDLNIGSQHCLTSWVVLHALQYCAVGGNIATSWAWKKENWIKKFYSWALILKVLFALLNFGLTWDLSFFSFRFLFENVFPYTCITIVFSEHITCWVVPVHCWRGVRLRMNLSLSLTHLI